MAQWATVLAIAEAEVAAVVETEIARVISFFGEDDAFLAEHSLEKLEVSRFTSLPLMFCRLIGAASFGRRHQHRAMGNRSVENRQPR